MKRYTVLVTQYFDTYLEWTKEHGEAESISEAETIKSDAMLKYKDRPLVSYGVRIRDNQKEADHDQT